ncbi:MAG: ATP phosphoribosyltransferase regulatory subunit [Zetaproteobacteria bacterium]|nr:MAG: ATP phosphoribosyltransferase regulatory subunit [Zetaproteobacteria bacterium]
MRPVVGIDDAFGVRAEALRSLQRRLAELFADAGYQEVIPPIVERPESLACGAGRFLAEQTIVFSDPADAGQLALRPDITPQIARLAATRLRQQSELRLHYSGPVVLARAGEGGEGRQQWQTGIELFGIGGIEAEIEVLQLAGRAMVQAGFDAPLLRIGHIGLLQSLLGEDADLAYWVALLRRRSPEDLHRALDGAGVAADAAALLTAMVRDGGDLELLRDHAGINDAFGRAVDLLDTLRRRLEEVLGGCCRVEVDGLLTPRFLYHSGTIFCGYAEGHSRVLLHGGRYDAMMAAHGRDLPAIGFSCDLWRWI